MSLRRNAQRPKPRLWLPLRQATPVVVRDLPGPLAYLADDLYEVPDRIDNYRQTLLESLRKPG